MNRYVEAFKRYAEFHGRSRREEYWMFVIFNLLFAIVAVVLDHVSGLAIPRIGYGPIYILYALVTFIPGLALTVRRLHDTGKSGWMVLIGLIPLVGIWLLIILATEGDATENQYGPNPKTTNSENALMIKDTPQGNDNLVIFVIIWIVFSRLFYFVLSKIDAEYFFSDLFKYSNALFSIIWGVIPLLLALSIKDKKKQVFLFVLAGIYIIMAAYDQIQGFI
jgi:uncharacterized membrane protein YhaH (DUF805 family)